MKKQNTTWKQIEKELKQYTNQILANTAGQIRDELTEETLCSIEDFYNDYTPLYYKRHYYNFYNNSFTKYYSNAHGTIFRGGVQLTPELLDDIYQDSTEEVFDSVFAGFHGVSSMFFNPKSFSVTPRMTPSPMERILNKRSYIIDNINDYVKRAIKNVK